MSHRLSMKELDEQFELFLKEMTQWIWASPRSSLLMAALKKHKCHEHLQFQLTTLAGTRTHSLGHVRLTSQPPGKKHLSRSVCR
ncbi:Hypothetical protein SMAX5B_013713 [Scophthalmus maximus]|uniref:Uncharacterized protein n=1 Tax=Scophthalmus maximus TaxID=52904 RepID=A0A2U9AZS1_SCOMX|nr:Hypothetical protein SMAX5B_013713 [Scophthalmus maximus]